MTDSELTTLSRRIDTLERQNRRLKQTAVVGVLGLAAVLLMGQTARPAIPKIVEAEQFVLKDSNGLVRGRWWVQDSGFLALDFISSPDSLWPAGRRRMMLFTAPDESAGLTIVNRPGDPVIVLEADAKGVGGLALHDYDRRRRGNPGKVAALETHEGGLAALRLYDGSSQPRVNITLKEYGIGDPIYQTARDRFTILYDPALTLRDRLGAEHHLWKAP